MLTVPSVESRGGLDAKLAIHGRAIISILLESVAGPKDRGADSSAPDLSRDFLQLAAEVRMCSASVEM